jgi:hypothetical protein
VWSELPIAGLAFGLVLAFLLRAVHAHVFAYAGVLVIVPTVGGAFLLLLAEWRSERKAGRRNATGDVARAAKV